MNDVTRILSAIEAGDPQAAEQLLPLVYDELRQLAAQQAGRARSPGQTLQATALVHEAYLRLVGGDDPAAAGTAAATSSPPRPRPCAASSSRTPAASSAPDAAAAICARVDLDEVALAWPSRSRGRPAGPRRGPRGAGRGRPARAELVKLRYFAGLTIPQAAAALGISPRSADLLWAYSRPGCSARWAAPTPGRRPGTLLKKFARSAADSALGGSLVKQVTHDRARHLPSPHCKRKTRPSVRPTWTSPGRSARIAPAGGAVAAAARRRRQLS